MTSRLGLFVQALVLSPSQYLLGKASPREDISTSKRKRDKKYITMIFIVSIVSRKFFLEPIFYAEIFVLSGNNFKILFVSRDIFVSPDIFSSRNIFVRYLLEIHSRLADTSLLRTRL